MVEAARNENSVTRLLRRAVDVKPDEVRALGWSCAYFFFILSAYYIIRPLREQVGVAGGVRNLPWLFTGTLTAMLLVHPPFAALVARFPRKTFVPLANRFFALNLLAFYVLFRILPAENSIWAGRVFFVWTSVFNLFVISVFWSFMTDVFSTPQGKRLFGFIGFGGTLGGITGSTVTASLAPVLGPVNLLLISMLLLELSVMAVRRLSTTTREWNRGDKVVTDSEAVIGGSTFAGIRQALSNPYLLGISAYMLLFTIGSTVLYFQQAAIADRAFTEAGSRTAFFARIDLAVNILTLATQMFLTGRIVKVLGIALTLTLLPALSLTGFLALGLWPTVAVFVAFQVLRRAGEFAVARPAREVLYTVMSREDKYKAKNFIDTFVYRTGDQIGAWTTAGLLATGLTASAISFLAAPLALVWLLVGWWLGRVQETKASSSERLQRAVV